MNLDKFGFENLSVEELKEVHDYVHRLMDVKKTRKRNIDYDELVDSGHSFPHESDVFDSAEEMYRDHKGLNDIK